MSLPNQINSAVPAGSDLPSTLDNRIRNLALAVEDIFGVPDVTNISNALFGIAASGLQSANFQDTSAFPSTAGHLQRNGASLNFHDGTTSRGVVFDTAAVTLTNKTLTQPTVTSPNMTSGGQWGGGPHIVSGNLNNCIVVASANQANGIPSLAHLMNVAGGHLWGCGLSPNASDMVNDIDIAAGEAASQHASASNRVVMSLPSTLTKRLDASWVVGNNQGGLSSSLTLSNTTYHVHLIRVLGVDDVGFDTSVTAANLITDHGATAYRRLGSILREAATAVSFNQTGDYYQRHSPVQDVVGTTVASDTLVTLSVPAGLRVLVLIRSAFDHSAADQGTVITDPATKSIAANAANPGGMSTPTLNRDWFTMSVYTNTSRQIRLNSTEASRAYRIVTYGWIDTRGKDE